MIIEKKRVMNVEKYLISIPQGSKIRLAVPIKALTSTPQKFKNSGFPPDIGPGDTILPSAVGTISRFNSEGAWKKRTDLPKESRYIRTVRWTWKQWSGYDSYEECEDFKDIFRDCYQREFITPPCESLSYILIDNEGFIISREFIVDVSAYSQIKHAMNLVLEIFGVCHLLDQDMTAISLPKTRILNWKLLPRGEYPWETLKPYIESKIKTYASSVTSVIWDRQKTIYKLGPSAEAIGTGGFSDYVAYIFSEKGLVVLESIHKGNAIYVFGKDWEQVSKLTKAQILSGNLHICRIIHSKGWKTQLAKLLNEKKPEVLDYSIKK